ncbi:MAG: diguanylate cyclase [Comamonadaceae bacterium]|jgi:diguanylate cyclase (GGDEF)-like protein/PAS domain S-box-containing protein
MNQAVRRDARILARTLRWIASGIAGIVALCVPLGYWLVVYNFQAEATFVDAEIHADMVTERININPDLWRFEIPRLDAIAATHRGTETLPESHSIVDMQGQILVQSMQALASPVLTRSAPLLDSGTVVGHFVSSRSLRPQMQSTVLVTLFSFLLALLIYISLSVLPLRELTHTLNTLEQERHRLRAVVDNAVEGILTFDAQGTLLSLNPAAQEMFERPGVDMVGRLAADLLPQIDLAESKTSTGLVPGRTETLAQRHDGTVFPIELALSRAIVNGETQWIAITHDITERKQVEQSLRDGAEELRLFAENVPAMTVSFDIDQRCLFANKLYKQFFGFETSEIVGMQLREIVGAEVHREIEPHFLQAMRGHALNYHRTHQLKSNECRFLEVKLLPHIDAQGAVLGCFSVTTDITEHVLAAQRLDRVAHHDTLTGLPNRLLFNDRLAQAISLARRGPSQFALLYLDLDRFKQVNDGLGHTAGDELLQAVADRIRQQVRESDTVARIGGDEFAVILPNILKREEAQTVAQKIINALTAPFVLGSQGREVEIGTSIGIAICPADAPDADELVKLADIAMYSAKITGNSFQFCAAAATAA